MSVGFRDRFRETLGELEINVFQRELLVVTDQTVQAVKAQRGHDEVTSLVGRVVELDEAVLHAVAVST